MASQCNSSEGAERDLLETKAIDQLNSTTLQEYRSALKRIESLLPTQEKHTPVTFNISGNVYGQLNAAGQSINLPKLNVSIEEIINSIDASDAPIEQKESAREKLAEFLKHPLVSAVIGGLSGSIIG